MKTVPGGQFPSDLTDILRLELTTLGDDLIAAIAREVPPYARPLEGSFGRGVRQGVEEALLRFLTVVDTDSSGPPDLAASREIYVRLGRGEFRSGRSLDTLLGAYRVGARVAWRRLAEAARRGGLDADGLVSLAETMFAYIDRISGATAEGYAQEQSEAASERGRLWDRLGELMLSGGSPTTIEQIARAASYRLPEIIAAVLLPGSAGTGQDADNAECVGESARERVDHRLRCLALPPDTPRTIQGEDSWVFVADPAGPGRRGWLERALAGLDAIVGPAVPWRESSASAARAAFARKARDHGTLPGVLAGPGGTLFTDDHLAELLFARDPALLADLACHRLAPLDGLPARVRTRLAETLLLWLRLWGQRGRIAAELQVHPQTVRYRLSQLRTLFGESLDDPDVRFELELVLRAGLADTPHSPAATTT
ncbi:helix-turn-helix domain-containing protein [Candidatus Protofrankia californiensis]|uniref:PucR family transcriptional regulator n=1 Tax=Candidatus Protofrankia californiensis TaxID=1839754 RepID=UPI003D34D130